MGYSSRREQKEYQRNWMQGRRLAFFHDKVCAICGSKDNLELDHIDPLTKITHAIWSWEETRRNKELEKCQVLCKECHRIKTNASLPTKPLIHGTSNAYDGKGCRCNECRAGNTERARIRKAKRTHS